MSESMSSPWIRDYLVGIAETYGTQLYNAPVSNGKKRVQLTDFLTYQENGYIWAWVSDKEHKVSVRISNDAIDEYKRKHNRRVIDSRFFLVFIASYRPTFSPRPLGPNMLGNTPASHISLEVNYISSIGMGGHLFGYPRDLESDEKVKEWVLGLRQDGGGGNILKLRKQQELEEKKKASPSPPSPPPFSLYAPVSQCQNSKSVDDTAKLKPERPKDLKRTYSKRWRRFEVDPWKLATKPADDNNSSIVPILTESSRPHVEPCLDPETREPCRGEFPIPPNRTPLPTSSEPQGTPTDWSPSNRGSPLTSERAKTFVLGNKIQQHGEPDFLPTTSHLPSDTERHTTVGTPVPSDARSLPSPTPAQRIKPLSPPPSSLPHCSPPELFTRSPPPPPSSSLPFPSSSLPIPWNIQKNIQRRVPYPKPLTPRPDPANPGPVRILVPNSDTSGTGSSQSYSQSHNRLRPQLSQSQLMVQPPTFSLSLEKEFEPTDESTPRDAPVHTPPRLSGRPGSRGSMHSLFSASFGDERTLSSQGLVSSISQNVNELPEKESPAHGLRHDPEAWKEPTFIARNKEKWKARVIEESDASNAVLGRRRQRSVEAESPVPKRAKCSTTELGWGASGNQGAEAPTLGTIRSDNQPSSSHKESSTERATPPLRPQLSKPRLASFTVDFQRIDLGNNVPIPRLTLDKGLRSIMSRTDRIRRLGKAAERDGSVYLEP